MEIKGVLMGLCLSASIVTLPVVSEVSACGGEGAKDQAAFHVQNKLPSKLGWSAEHPSKNEINTHLWLFNQAEKILAKDVTVTQLDLVRELKKYNKEIAQGIFDADHKNPYYDKNTFLSHFYNPKTHKTYIAGFPNAKDTGTK
ncbi:phospholipase, partial [Listeria seeligeri]|nr:phospholipase [Listeria seeligeri]